MTSVQVLTWVRRVVAQKVQSAILENLKEKYLDRVFTRNKTQSQDEKQL